jgi:VIT1/CCC1 family predicted Fe2+/Mn2+ transporter
MRHEEHHRSERIGWLRAAVMGANEGIVSVASLILGVAAAGMAGLVAGAMSMAAGEYISVSSQADTEESDLTRERGELATNDASERAELAGIYVSRGLDLPLARQVADQLMAHDALGAHARDELGISEIQRARPVQAALASAATFAVGAGLPLLITLLVPAGMLTVFVVGTSLACLAILGTLAAHAGGARRAVGALRVTFWGAFAMALTYGVGALFGTVVQKSGDPPEKAVEKQRLEPGYATPTRILRDATPFGSGILRRYGEARWFRDAVIPRGKNVILPKYDVLQTGYRFGYVRPPTSIEERRCA